MSHIGELFAIATAFCWTITSLSFQYASKKTSEITINFLKMLIGLILLALLVFLQFGHPFPTNFSSNQWILLSISGFVGFVIGDYFLLKGIVILGARVAMLVMASVPPISAILGYFFLSEILGLKELFAMIITLLGIILVILKKDTDNKKIEFSHSKKGLFFAFIGATGQASGLILSKIGMGNSNPLYATEIRLIAGFIGFALIVRIFKNEKEILNSLKIKKTILTIFIGAFFGTFLGVSFSLLAIKSADVSIVSTITATVPILIIPPSIIIFKEKITFREILGAFIAVIGVSFLFL